MATQPFDQEELAFLAGTGLDTEDLAWLVADAPPVTDDLTDRVLQIARRHAAPPAAAVRRSPLARSRRWVAAAVAVVSLGLVGSVAVAFTPGAQERLKGLLHLIPGFGVAEVQPGNLTLASPVTVADGDRKVTVTTLFSGDQGTEVKLRWDGLNAQYQDYWLDHVAPALRLPDGQRWQALSRAYSAIDLGTSMVSLGFPRLPAGTETVKLELPPWFGPGSAVTVTLPLKDAATTATAGIARPDRTAEAKGIRLRVPYLATDGSLIHVTLVADELSTEGGPAVNWAPGSMTLIDDLGRSYDFRFDQSMRSNRMTYKVGEPFTATFDGPVQDGAHSLRLTVDSVAVQEEGASRLVAIPIGDLKVGDSAAVDLVVQTGRVSFTITTIVRTEADQFRLWVAVPDQPRLLGFHSQIDVAGVKADRVATDFKNGLIEVKGEPVDDTLYLGFSKPVINLWGGWSFDLPVP